MKIYTKTGDQGQTSLVDGKKVSKSATRLSVYGGFDELNSQIGLLVAWLSAEATLFSQETPRLQQVQNQLFDMGSQLACEDSEMQKKLPGLPNDAILSLESEIDRLTSELPPLKNFILPGGHLAGAQAHVCRTVCRRIERDLVLFQETTQQDLSIPALPYLNRLSDFFFVLSRAINLRLKVATPMWTPAPAPKK